MNIILLVKRMQRPVKIHLSRSHIVALVVAVLVLPLAAASYLGFYWGSQYSRSEVAVTTADGSGAASTQTAAVEGAAGDGDVQETINALTSRLGVLQAEVIRLNALGKRLVDMAGLEKGEFNFGSPPPQGGPEQPPALEEQDLSLPGLANSVDSLNQQLEDRQQQLNVLETLFMNRNLLGEVLPAGRPVKNGWLSSYFGYRVDPFTGRRARHDGVDIAGKLGEPVMAVAAGVVTYAGKRYGYGNLVEINHGNGFVTRYGHNSVVKVKVGETVSKGQVVALMGSTGRSTGPHVHFEVWRRGRVVNPLKYLNASN